MATEALLTDRIERIKAALLALGPFIADRGSLKQRAGRVGGHRGCQAPLDRQLFALEPALQLSLRVTHLTLPRKCHPNHSLDQLWLHTIGPPNTQGERPWRPKPN